jgi:GNAT superfamily N-acetyltransferase
MTLETRQLDLDDEETLERIFPVLTQLRTQVSWEVFNARLQDLRTENYELWGCFEGERILGLASSRIYTDWVRGPHLYVDDLVTDAEARSRGIGALLLKRLELHACDLGLKSLRLSCVLENEHGLRFYRREGWKERAYALVKSL